MPSPRNRSRFLATRSPNLAPSAPQGERGARRFDPVLAAGVAPALAAAAALLVIVASLAGFDPLWPANNETLSEAAWAGDSAMIVKLLAAGVDPNAPATVHAGILGSRAVDLLPLDAAIGNGDVALVTILVDHGADIEGRRGDRAACLARIRGAPAILDYLKQRGIDPAPEACNGISKTW